MKSAFLGSMAALLLGAGWAVAQAPGYTTPAASPYNAGAPAPVLGASSVPGTPAVPGLSAAVNGCTTDTCGGGSSIYFYADYLLWRVRDGGIPPTATAVPVGLISVDISPLYTQSPDAPGTPSGTTVTGFAPVSITSTSQFGARSTRYGDLCGTRLGAGWWADCDQSWGIDWSAFMLERGGDAFASVAAVSGNQFLVDTGFTRTLFLVRAGEQTALNSFGVFAVRETTSQTLGSAAVTLFGTELNARSTCLHLGCFQLGGLVGFRYIHFRDELNIVNQVRLFRPEGFPITSGDATGSLSQDLTFRTADSIRIYNNFFGGQVGADVDARFGSFFVNARSKFGVGTITRTAEIRSATEVVNNDPVRNQPATRVASGGLLVSPNDVGTHRENRFGFVGEVNLKVGYQITDGLRAYVGYDGLYMGHMARAANSSVLNTLNTTVTVAASSVSNNVAAPTFRFREQDVWAQGLNFGFEVRY